MNLRLGFGFMALLLASAWCTRSPDAVYYEPTTTPGASVPTTQTNPPEPALSRLGYTFIQPDGNRLAAGSSDIRSSGAVEVELIGTPVWIVGAAHEDGIQWLVVMDDGQVEAVKLDAAGQITQTVLGVRLAPTQPPVVDLMESALADWTILEGLSPYTHPVLTEDGQLLWIDSQGDLVLSQQNGAEIDRLAVQALPDARLVQFGSVAALYAGATDFYDHAVLGDGLEGGRLVVVNTAQSDLEVVAEIEPPRDGVFEGLSPILVDWNQDGQAEILATVSNYDSGARLILFGLDGGFLAESDPIGQAYRWRHQLAVAPFEEDGEWLLASVLRPHLDGVVQLHAWRGQAIVEVGSLAGYSSHRLGERNLDRAVVGDFDGDGVVELLVPDLTMKELVLLGVEGSDLVEAWRNRLPDMMSTNLGVVELPDGNIAIAVGTQDGRLVVWIGESSEK